MSIPRILITLAGTALLSGCATYIPREFENNWSQIVERAGKGA